jgi:hypothetical protein
MARRTKVGGSGLGKKRNGSNLTSEERRQLHSTLLCYFTLLDYSTLLDWTLTFLTLTLTLTLIVTESWLMLWLWLLFLFLLLLLLLLLFLLLLVLFTLDSYSWLLTLTGALTLTLTLTGSSSYCSTLSLTPTETRAWWRLEVLVWAKKRNGSNLTSEEGRQLQNINGLGILITQKQSLPQTSLVFIEPTEISPWALILVPFIVT